MEFLHIGNLILRAGTVELEKVNAAWHDESHAVLGEHGGE